MIEDRPWKLLKYFLPTKDTNENEKSPDSNTATIMETSSPHNLIHPYIQNEVDQEDCHLESDGYCEVLCEDHCPSLLQAFDVPSATSVPACNGICVCEANCAVDALDNVDSAWNPNDFLQHCYIPECLCQAALETQQWALAQVTCPSSQCISHCQALRGYPQETCQAFCQSECTQSCHNQHAWSSSSSTPANLELCLATCLQKAEESVNAANLLKQELQLPDPTVTDNQQQQQQQFLPQNQLVESPSLDNVACNESHEHCINYCVDDCPSFLQAWGTDSSSLANNACLSTCQCEADCAQDATGDDEGWDATVFFHCYRDTCQCEAARMAHNFYVAALLCPDTCSSECQRLLAVNDDPIAITDTYHHAALCHDLCHGDCWNACQQDLEGNGETTDTIMSCMDGCIDQASLKHVAYR